MSIFGIDMDDTLISGGWPDISKATVFHEAIQAIKFIKSLGHTLILVTCRENKFLEDAKNLLKEHGVEFDYYNENAPWLIEQYGDCRKISCDYFIDDKNVGGINWDLVIDITTREYFYANMKPDRSNFGELFDFAFGKLIEIYGGNNERI